MAVLEQLIYGSSADDGRGRVVLAHTSGLSDECQEELVRLCEGWGAVPDGGLRRPVVLAFPLESHLQALPGDLHTVIRISMGLRPIYHAVVISSADFREFDHNPFALIQEGFFFDSWRGDQDLSRRTVSPTSLAPLVSPPPAAADVGSIDEAVRQVLASQRLLLPLESPTSDSERFLALATMALPRPLRMGLRLASWAPSGINRYTLAATYKDSALFAAWQPYLMTCITGDLDPAVDGYLDDLRRCLGNGDLAGIEQLSREARLGPIAAVGRPQRTKEPTLTATLDESSIRKLAVRSRSLSPASGPPQPDRRPRPLAATFGSAVAEKRQPSTGRRAPRRPHPRPRMRASGRVRRGFAIAVSLAIIGAGIYHLWAAGHWTHLPGVVSTRSSLESRTDHGVVDIGAVYRMALAATSEAQIQGQVSRQGSVRRRGLDLLRQAGELLGVQGQGYLQDGDHALVGTGRPHLSPLPVDRLQRRGAVLARELRRLAIARVSLRDGQNWRDVADLDAQGLSARYDSLVARRRLPGTDEPDLVAIDRLLRRLDVTNRQLRGLARLESLLAEDRWTDGWSDLIRTGVDELGAVRHGRAHDLRDDAELLARLKQAEHQSDQASRAFGTQETTEQGITIAVADVLPAFYRRVQHRGSAATSPLLVATAELYQGLAQAAAGLADGETLARLVPELEQNLAYRFDPALYGDHLSRVRFDLFAELVRTRVPADSLVGMLGSEQRVDEHLRFLDALSRPTSAEAWRELADRLADPFLQRWAAHQVARLEHDRNAILERLTVTCVDLAAGRVALQRLAASGGRCGEEWWRLADVAHRAREAAVTAGLVGDQSPVVRELLDHAAALRAPPPLDLAGVTVRLDPTLSATPLDVVVEVQVADHDLLTTAPFRLGPASPAGVGWVGAVDVAREFAIRAGDPIQMTVRPCEGDRALAEFRGTWLAEWDPVDLASLDAGQGVRVSWRLARPYWQELPVTPRR